MIGYKAFDKDLKCRGFQYEIGKTYELEGELKICKNGFHFCKTIKDCYEYYPKTFETRICKIEAMGDIQHQDTKFCTSIIKIVEEVPDCEKLSCMNLGNYNVGFYNKGNDNKGDYNEGGCNKGNGNKGNYNKGDYNKGNCNEGNGNKGNDNKGNYNKGDYNIGDYNEGSFNLCDYNVGFLCTKAQPIALFNKPSNMTYDELIATEALEAIEAVVSGCYTQKEIDIITSLPNFDADIFEEITGVRI